MYLYCTSRHITKGTSKLVSVLGENSNIYFASGEKEQAHLKKRHNFIVKNIKNSSIQKKFINFKSHEAYYLAMSLLLINAKNQNDDQKEFILKLTELILLDQELQEDYSHSRSRQNRQLDGTIFVRVHFLLNKILLYNELDFSKVLLNVLIKPF